MTDGDGCGGSIQAKVLDGTGRGISEREKQGLVCSQPYIRRGGLPTMKWHIRPSRLLVPVREDDQLDV